MKKPDIPENEMARLQALASLNILDTKSDERFDRLTRLATRVFNVPIALVSLVDEKRQWFKSCVGLSANETSREISFCGHAILSNDIFIINDASKDSRFADNPLVSGEPYIKFYAGCPLKYRDGAALGTLCIIDTKPRSFTSDDLVALKDLAASVEGELTAIELATMDELTNILNRRGFRMVGQHSLDLCIRQHLFASFIYLDLDDFKYINDQFGHANGDKALITFADILKAQTRDSDLIARVGGDEFVCMLINTSQDSATDFINRVQQSLLQYNKNAEHEYLISFTFGMVKFAPTAHASIDEQIAAADKIMYANKKNKK